MYVHAYCTVQYTIISDMIAAELCCTCCERRPTGLYIYLQVQAESRAIYYMQIIRECLRMALGMRLYNVLVQDL